MRLRPGPSCNECRTPVVAALCILFVSPLSVAQTPPVLPSPGNVAGIVTDSSGSVIVSAIVTLQPAAADSGRTTLTDASGSFQFSAVAPGAYSLTIIALGFTDRKIDVSVVSGENPSLPPAVLEVAPAIAKVDVSLPPHELAAQQVHQEEKQRLIGIFPNFYVSYQSNAAPLTAAQKFQLGWRTLIDPETIISTAIGAGISQARNSNHQFGQGSEGYSRRFGASYADTASGVLIGHVLTQSVFHQDPRYFYKGTGGFGSRFLYAIATAFVCKGDNGHWQFDYSTVIGHLASGEIATLYYPASSRTGRRLFDDVLLGFSGRAQGHLLQEFVYRKFTTHAPKILARNQPILRDGTPVSLISVEDLRSAAAQTGKPVTFVVAKDLEVSGVLAAKAGSQATGQVSYAPAPAAAGPNSIQLSLENVHLKVSGKEVLLRSSPQKGGADPLEYHWVEDTGRIALVLYVAQNVALLPPQ
ncbi:MAG TPA: carboxypeptidase-like regulatory domain-containing protein [Bryobacteraceae bacterium]|nr:carboxypeptidase-like regulatory domain-containing protein [Bryobacteraceae bacterium]